MPFDMKIDLPISFTHRLDNRLVANKLDQNQTTLPKVVQNLKELLHKIKNGLATLADEDDACTNPECAYEFARAVKGANIAKCEEAACKDPEWSYVFARDIEGANIEKCQEEACQNTLWAYMFAMDVKGADIKKCEEGACKDPGCAYWFARNVKGANIEKCRKVCEGTEYAF